MIRTLALVALGVSSAMTGLAIWVIPVSSFPAEQMLPDSNADAALVVFFFGCLSVFLAAFGAWVCRQRLPFSIFFLVIFLASFFRLWQAWPLLEG